MANLLSNPSFETDTSTWGVNDGTLSREASGTAYVGDYVARVVIDASPPGTQYLIGAWQPITLDSQYAAGIYVRQTAGTAKNVRMDIQIGDDTAFDYHVTTGVLSGTKLGSAVTGSGSWQRTVEEGGGTITSGTHPGATQVRTRVAILSPAAGDTFEFDAAQLEIADTLPDYSEATDHTATPSDTLGLTDIAAAAKTTVWPVTRNIQIG